MQSNLHGMFSSISEKLKAENFRTNAWINYIILSRYAREGIVFLLNVRNVDFDGFTSVDPLNPKRVFKWLPVCVYVCMYVCCFFIFMVLEEVFQCFFLFFYISFSSVLCCLTDLSCRRQEKECAFKEEFSKNAYSNKDF